MKQILIVALFCVAGAWAEELVLAGPCDPALCLLPDCRCSGTDTPGDLETKNVPQFVMVTYDDAVSSLLMPYYRDSLYARRNPHGCPVAATYFVSHEYTDYSMVNELYNYGQEIALHSITHTVNMAYWAEATVETLKAELEDQRTLISHFANIPREAIQGIRLPFLQMAGNNSFVLMKEYGIKYDMTWTTQARNLWPYTTDYTSTQDCPVPPCPTASIEGTWVIPMLNLRDPEDFPCAFVDACLNLPTTVQELFVWLVENFESHYLGNRAPFGLFMHAAWFLRDSHAFEAYQLFLDYLGQLDDVFIVNGEKVIEWVQNPVPVSELREHEWGRCAQPQNAFCLARSCPLVGEANGMTYWMTSCATCPAVYPWINNPLGLA